MLINTQTVQVIDNINLQTLIVIFFNKAKQSKIFVFVYN